MRSTSFFGLSLSVLLLLLCSCAEVADDAVSPLAFLRRRPRR